MNNLSRVGFDNSTDVQRLRSVFQSANYSQSGIEEFLGYKTPIAPLAVKLPHMILCADCESPLETLMHLFLLNRPTDTEAVRRAIAPMNLETWIQAGLLQVENQRVVPSVRIAPYSDLLLACDRVCTRDTPDSADFVMGMGGSSLALADATIRANVESTLDLGTGSGIQSLLAARHSRNVCGADRNPRALEIARFNARLNDMDHIEFVEGDLFEPVTSRRFDLVVMNPPYVISPDFRAYYCDNQQPGDAFCQQIVQQVPSFLNEGGVFQMYFDWARTTGQPWQERLAQWCKGSNCDAWVIHKVTRAPSEYTLFWNNGTANKAGFKELYDRWMGWYDEQGIEAIATGLITLRRRSGAQNWFRADDEPVKMLGPIGDDIRQIFDAADWLSTRGSEEDLLRTRFQLADNVRMDQQLRPTTGRWQVESAQLRRTSGLGYTGVLNSDTATLLCQCDGEQTLGELLRSFAAARNTSVEELKPSHLNVVRQLLCLGFLVVNTTAAPVPVEAALGVADATPFQGAAVAEMSRR